MFRSTSDIHKDITEHVERMKLNLSLAWEVYGKVLWSAQAKENSDCVKYLAVFIL